MYIWDLELSNGYIEERDWYTIKFEQPKFVTWNEIALH